MIYIENEMKKIKYSKLNYFIYIFVALYTLLLFAMYTYFDSDRSIFLFYFKVFSGLGYLIFLIIPVAIIGFLFGKEYEDRTMLYVLLRPIEMYKLFISKIMATIKIMSRIIVVITIITFLYGIFIFKLVPLAEIDTFFQSILKSAIFMVYTYVMIFVYIGISLILNLIIKRFIISSVVTTLIGLISSIATITISIGGIRLKMSMTTLLTPAAYYDIPFNDFITKCSIITIINLIVICILLFVSYRKYIKSK